MCRKLILLISIVLVLGLVNSALATDHLWTNDDGDADWCEENNWTPAGGPPEGSPDTAIIDERSPNRGPIVGIGCNVDVGEILGPEPNWGHIQVIDINTSGTVEIGSDGWMWTMEDAPGGAGTAVININGTPTITINGDWRGADYGMGIINIAGEPNITIDGTLRGADMASGSLYFTMSGGYLNIDSEFVIGDVGGGAFNMHGGTMIVGGALDLGGLRGTIPIDVNMTGGYLYVPDEFRLPGSGSRAGAVFYLKGGVLDCNDFVHGQDEADNPYTDDWRLDIEQGTLKIWFDKRAAIDANVANGQITGYDGEGTVVVEFIDGNTVVTALPPDPNTARDPYPRKGATMVDPNVVLTWTAGVNATEHRVFFGTSFQEVNEMTDPCVIKPLGDETYDPNGLGPLELETTYYWRIDAADAVPPNHPDSPWKGRIWYFTTKSPVIDPNMLMWLKLDETSGWFAKDSSGYGNNGIVDGNELGWDPCDGHPHDGGSRKFNVEDDDDDASTVIDIQSSTLLNTIDDSITVTVWLKDAYNGDDDNWVFHTGVGGQEGPYQVGACVVTEDLEPEGQAYWRAGSDTNDVLTWNLDGRNPETLEGWHLWCFVKDENVDEMRIYFDGIMVKDRSGTFDTLANVHDVAFKIGATSWENYTYMGKQDDFRLWDYALSDKKIEELYRGADVGQAWAPSPGDYQENVPRDANLSWRPGNYTQDVNGHEVFFGTSWKDVNSMTDPCAVQDACEYDPCLLELDTTYYWRIDEVCEPCTWPGPIWRFTTADFIVIDDFESYNETDKKVAATWYDNLSNSTGSFCGLSQEKYGGPVHSGVQAMLYEYYTDAPPAWFWITEDYAEAWLEYDPPMDWTAADVRLLVLFFYGKPTNDTDDTEQMYVGLEDSNDTYAEIRYGDKEGEDMNDLKIEEWQRWAIPFTYFNDSNFAAVPNDVNFASVFRFSIGFGNRRNPVPAGKGGVYFDDIRLNLPICIPEEGPIYDLSGDCIVGLADLGILGLQWLNSDVNFPDDLGITVKEPCDVNLVGHWKLDEGSGTFAEDSSANNNHGTVEETDEGSYSWVAGRIGTYAVEFTGGRVDVPDACELRPKHQVSVSAWIYIRENMSSARVVVKGENDHETYELEVDDDDTFIFQFRDGNHVDHERPDINGVVWPDDWIHLAGTYDGNIIACYVNGQLGDSKDANNPYGLAWNCPDPCGFAIGNKAKGDANDTPFEGRIDDVRVYDYGLSQAEVAWLTTEETGYFALTTKANFFIDDPDPEVINFKDLAEMLEHWGDRKFWPPEPGQ